LILLACGKAAILHLVRSDISSGRCLLLTLAADVLSVGVFVPLTLVSPLSGPQLWLSRLLCLVVIAGHEVLAPLLLFGSVNLLVTGLLLMLLRRDRLSRSWLAAALADGGMTAILAVLVVLLLAPPPFLYVLQTPRDPLARRVSVCSPPVPSLAQLAVNSPPVTPTRGLLPIVTAPSPTPVPVQQALAYLQKQYDPQVGLLRESPTTAPHKYWLVTDNLVALYALRTTGGSTLTDEIAATLKHYNSPTHGLIEILGGQTMSWPPYVETQQQVATVGSAEVWLETRTAGAQYQDWAEYADLTLYGALNARNRGQFTEARHIYQDAMRLFDGVGFADRAFRADGVYATYKLALAIYVAQASGEPVDARLWSALLTKQASTSAPAAYVGGFYTLYDRQGQPLNDPNTETTAYALLALSRGAPVTSIVPAPIRTPFPTPAPVSTRPAPTATRVPTEFSSAIQRGVAFLKSQYNPDLGLLQESPDIGQHNYYLTNDNVLAAYTLETLGVEPELAVTLHANLKRYGYDRNGFVETVWGVPVTWPPYHHSDKLVTQIGENRILQEAHDGPGYFYDWSAFSNLAFMAALNEYNLGYRESARRLYEIEMSKFDGVGWRDLAYDRRGGVYETLGVAYSLLAAARIGAPLDERVLQALLEQQDPRSGGFHTHYQADLPRQADPNVETTCIALLALHAWSR